MAVLKDLLSADVIGHFGDGFVDIATRPLS